MKPKRFLFPIAVIAVIVVIFFLFFFKQPISRELLLDDDPTMGPENAKVTFVEFSDYRCPYCMLQAVEIKKLRDEFSDRVLFSFRDMPNDSSHPGAYLAALSSECADKQGKFWEFHDLLFESEGKVTLEMVKDFAFELGLDEDQFLECVLSDEFNSEVLNDLKQAREFGVRGTPSYFINGIMFEGFRPFSELKQLLEAQLGT